MGTPNEIVEFILTVRVSRTREISKKQANGVFVNIFNKRIESFPTKMTKMLRMWVSSVDF